MTPVFRVLTLTICLASGSVSALAQSQLSAIPGNVALSGTVLNVQVAVAGSGPFTIVPTGPFFSVSEASDTAPATFLVSLSNTTCSNGNLTCNGSITLHPASASGGSDVSIGVTFTPGAAGGGGAVISANPASVVLNAFPGQSVATAVSLTTNSVQALPFTFTQSPQNSWLTVTFSNSQVSANGTSPGPATMTLFANTTGLFSSQTGSVTITPTGGSPTVIPVTLNLAGSSGSTLSAGPASVALVYPGTPQSQHVTVFSSSATVTAFNAQIANCTGAIFLLLSGGVGSGTILAGQPVANGLDLQLSNPQALQSGSYACQVVLSNPASASDQVTIPVSLTVNGASACAQPLCVNRTDDSASAPVSGMLRYAVLNAPAGATIAFDPALNGQTITLDTSSVNNHIRIGRDLTIQGPGPLTISGGSATRIFFIAGGNVTISGLTLANGLARGFDGAVAGGGAAGMGGAIFLNGGFLTLRGVVFSGNRVQGGNGGSGAGGGGGGFGSAASGDQGGNGGDLGGSGGSAGFGGHSQLDGGNGGPGGGGGAGGIGPFYPGNGGGGGFAGGGGAGASSCVNLQAQSIGSGGSGGFGGGGGAGGASAGGFGGGSGAIIRVSSCFAANPTVPGGGGGAGFGGAVFANAGSLLAINTTFLSNITIPGNGGAGAANGQAKGGALFVCSSSFCGAGHDASVTITGVSLFQGNTAPNAGAAQQCPGRDDSDICGSLAAATPTHFSVTTPPSFAQGQPFAFTVTALDSNNHTVFAYTGPVRFASSDIAAALPPVSSLTSGSGTFIATLNTLGNQSLSVMDAGNSIIAATSNIITVVAGGQFSAVSVNPPSGSANNQTFTFTFNDPSGYQDLDVVNVLIASALDGRQACYLAFSRPLNTLYLVNDAGTALLPDSQVSNSQCSFNGNFASIAQGSGNTLLLTLNLSFTASFAGNKIIFLAARSATQNTGWQALGTWTVPGSAPTSPGVGGVNPPRASGLTQTFTFSFTDTKGYQDLGIVNVLINDFLDGRRSCYLAYSRPLNTLYLVDDLGNTLLPGVALNGSGSVSNSQCGVNGALSSTSVGGNLLSLTLTLTFSQTFAGNRIVYMAARDLPDTSNSGWQPGGTFTVGQ